MITSLTVDPKLGFIGIGSMGRPIARCLLESGYTLTAYNRDRSKADALVGYGATLGQKAGLNRDRLFYGSTVSK